MATKKKISDLNQFIEVRLFSEVELPDGNTDKDYDTVRFSTPFANVEAISNNQGFSEGVSEKESYYKITFRYDPARAIEISDKVIWNNREFFPVGDCVVSVFGNKKFFVQKVKYKGG